MSLITTVNFLLFLIIANSVMLSINHQILLMSKELKKQIISGELK